MKKGLFGLLLTAMLLCAAAGAQAQTAYPLPAEIGASQICEVRVNGTANPVMDTAVNLSRTWTSRPITTTAPVTWVVWSEPVTVSARFIGKTVESAVVRPLSLGITPTVEGDTVTFSLDAPAALTVEINGGQEDALHLFADTPMDVPAGDTVTVYDAGIHDVGTVTLTDGQTVYLAPGAVVRGKFAANGAKNITVCGHGIIDGSVFDRWNDTVVPIDLTDCANISIEGVTILDPAAWTVNLYRCRDAVINDVKIIGARSNSDGITLQSCTNIAVTGCFVRGWDDNLVVKGYDGDVDNIRFTDCVLWTDLAQSCEVGYETRADVIRNITFENITVLHANHKPVMSIHNSDQALVEQVTFRNITVEDCNLGQGDGATFLIDLTTTKSQWSKSKERGNIRDVLIENVNVLSGTVPAVRIFAFNKDHTIDNVTIRNLTLLGQKITSFDELRYTFSPRKLGANIVIEP